MCVFICNSAAHEMTNTSFLGERYRNHHSVSSSVPRSQEKHLAALCPNEQRWWLSGRHTDKIDTRKCCIRLDEGCIKLGNKKDTFRERMA